MRPDDLILRGYAIKDGDSYFAICLDLNIYARGESPDEAIERCLQFVEEYINEAISDDSEHAPELLSRKAPLRFWIRYRIMLLIYKLSRLMHDDDDKPKHGGPFETPMPIRVGC